MSFKRITQEQLDEMQFNAGILLRSFDADNPIPQDEDIICATTGGFALSVSANYIDLGEGIYMMPPGVAEMMKLDGWTVEVSFTAIGYSAQTLKMMLSAAEVSEESNRIEPRAELQESDFMDLWWVGDRVDGGFVAVKLMDVMSEDGFQIQTGENDIGQSEVRMVAHSSLEKGKEGIPVEIYSNNGLPEFSIPDHAHLIARNVSYDTFTIDTSTGELFIEETGNRHYEVIKETGRMEVTIN